VQQHHGPERLKVRKTRLYRTSFHDGTVDVFDGRCKPVKVKGATCSCAFISRGALDSPWGLEFGAFGMLTLPVPSSN
jgi:hypothetical protein